MKGVVHDRKDYEYFISALNKHPTRANVTIAPVIKKSLRYGHKPSVSKELIDWLLQDRHWNVRVGYQLHKVMGVQ